MLKKTIKLSDLKAICHMAEMHYDMLEKNEGKNFPKRDMSLRALAIGIQTSFRTNWIIENDVSEN